MEDKLGEHHQDYISTVVRYVQSASQEIVRKISIVELCAGGGGLTELVLEQLGEIDFKIYMVDKDFLQLVRSSVYLKNWEEDIVRLYRDIRDISTPLKFPFNEIRREKGLTAAIVSWLCMLSDFSNEIIEEESIDLLVGQGPFTFIDPIGNGVQRTAEGITKLLRSEGHAIILEGYNLAEEIVGEDLYLGVSPERRERLFADNGLSLIEGPRRHTILGRSPFHYSDVSVYRKE